MKSRNHSPDRQRESSPPTPRSGGHEYRAPDKACPFERTRKEDQRYTRSRQDRANPVCLRSCCGLPAERNPGEDGADADDFDFPLRTSTMHSRAVGFLMSNCESADRVQPRPRAADLHVVDTECSENVALCGRDGSTLLAESNMVCKEFGRKSPTPGATLKCPWGANRQDFLCRTALNDARALWIWLMYRCWRI